MNIRTPDHEALAYLAGGGEMGALFRDFDWSRTRLGPPSAWPQSLKTAVGLMLKSKYPMFLAWGDELSFLYNDGYRPILGRKHPAALARPFEEVWAEIWHDIRPLVDRALAGEATWSENLPLFMERSGYVEESYFTFSYSPLHDESNRVGGMFCACTETTRLVVGERRLALLRELASRTADARTLRDAHRHLADALRGNPHDLPFTVLWSARADRFALACTSGIDPAHPAASEAAAAAGTWPLAEALARREILVVESPGARFDRALPTGPWDRPPQRAALVPIAPSGDAVRGGVLVAGLNPYQILDADYRNFLSLAADQIGAAWARAAAFEEEKKRAESLAELDRAKTAFFSNISHEFRTPLTLILGPLEDLLARPEPALDAPLREQIDTARRNSMRLLKLVNTLLDFSRLEAGRVDARFEAVDLATLTTELASVFRAAVERAGLRFEVDARQLPAKVYVDREMWEKIVLNLLSNAFKFTLEGGIAVSLRPAARPEAAGGTEPRFVELEVRDSGMGIPADELPRIFDRFHRVRDARGRTLEGTGIGLALVQELVRLHGGRISVESEVGRGSRFVVAIPFGSAHLPADRIVSSPLPAPAALQADAFVEEALRWLPPIPAGAAKGAPMLPVMGVPRLGPAIFRDASPDPVRPAARVLWADDNADMRGYVARLLQSAGLEVTAVSDGLAAVEAARAAPPELVLCDIMMPRLDGLGLLRELRADAALRHVPVIFLSARAGEEARIEGLLAGADDYLTKPFSARELLARVESHLKLAQLRREADDAFRLLRTITDNAPALISYIDRERRYRFVNREYERWFGRAREQVLGRTMLEVLGPEVADALNPHIEAVLRGEPVHFEKLAPYREGGARWIDAQYVPDADRDGRIRGFFVLVLDVTERKAAEEALREADRRKDAFLATLAHELRNPLAPILNAVRILQMRGPSSPDLDWGRGVIERQVGHMARLLDDLLDVSRITRSKLELRSARTELASVVASAVETSRPLIDAEGHELTVELPPEPVHLNADPMRLAQVFSNLLNNAAKYSERGGRIRLSAACDGGPPGRRSVVVEVSDTGIGIAPDELPRVFEMFWQADPSIERSQAGLGIGLSLARGLVEIHGGTLEARSEGIGRGSTFAVRLPVVEAAPAASAPRAAAAPGAGARSRILVADDNDDASATLAMILQMLGHEVRCARDGEEAVRLASEFRPDLALLDIGMPRLNGYEAARRIRGERGPDVRLVALTGWGQPDDKRQAGEAGFDAHMIKPVDFGDLEALIARLLKPETRPKVSSGEAG